MKLKEIIHYEKKLYFSTRKEYIKERLFHSNKYKIFKWQSFLRKEEYYAEKSKANKLFLLCLIFYRRKKNKLGRILGFDIPGGCLSQDCGFGMLARLSLIHLQKSEKTQP